MFAILNSLIIGLLPWGLGIVALYALTYQSNPQHPGHHLVLFGLGSYIGYLLLALLMYQLQARNLPVFSNWITAWAIAILIFCWAIGQLGRHTCKQTPFRVKFNHSRIPKKTEPRWLAILLTTWLMVQFAFVAYEVALRPAVSWDSMAYWTRFIDNFIQWQEMDPGKGSVQLGERHPSTVHLLHIWAAHTGLRTEGKIFLYLPWLVLYAGILLCAVGFTWKLTSRLFAGLMAGILIGSSPVSNAQVSLAGYADIWLAGGLFFSVAAISLMNANWKPAIAMIWIFIAASLAFIKSAGITYTVLLSGVALAAWAVSLHKLKRAVIAFLVLIIAVGALYIIGFDTTILGYQIKFDPETGSIRVGRYGGDARFTELGIAVRNLWFAYVYNTSYLIVSVITLVTLIFAPMHFRIWRQFSSAYALLLGLALLLYGMVAQTISGHFFTYSSPDKDTGLTRFSQGWFLVTALLLSYMMRAHYEMQKLKKKVAIPPEK